MNKNVSSDENNINIDIDEMNLPKTRSFSKNSESYDLEETANVSYIREPTTRPSSKDLTASHLAKVIVWAFCISMGFSFVFASIDYVIQTQSETQEQIDINKSLEIFKTVSAVMSGPLGFVLGFYFRESK